MENNFHKIINEICIENNIKMTILSKEWIIMLEKNGITKFIAGYKFDLNEHGLGNVIDDKYALYEVLKTKNIPVIEHQILFKNNNTNDYALGSNSYDKSLELFKKWNNNIVIKVNNGTCGNGVYHITKEEDVIPCIEKLFVKEFSISLCPFYKIKTEYRAIILDNECAYIYGKKKPVIIGDGVRTVKELLLEFNNNYYKEDNHFNNPNYPINYIPKQAETIEYNWQFNLSKGAQIENITDNEKLNKLKTMAINISREINLKFGSVDIIETDEEYMVLEINSGVMMENLTNLIPNGYLIAKQIYSNAINKMFI